MILEGVMFFREKEEGEGVEDEEQVKIMSMEQK
jgi:hypothetical protein